MEEKITSPSENKEATTEIAKTTKEPTKPAQKDKNEKKSISDIIGVFKGEFGKIIWPSRKELIKKTTTVIITSLMFGVIIFGMDSVLGFAYQLLLGLLS